MREINCPNACGKCCEVIILRTPHKKLFSYYQGIELMKLFRPISKKIATKLNPELIPHKKGYYFYTCYAFDKEEKKCRIYNDRPDVCKYYPFYENVVVNKSSLLKDCYWANQVMKVAII
jgi:Fe-S-cluster containining protein